MKVNTRHFGEVEVSEDIILNFTEPLAGFPESKRFIIIEEIDDNGVKNGLFHWLQSIDEPEVSLALMDVAKIKPDYDPSVSVDELKELGDIDADPFFFYNVVVIPEQVEKMSVNLRAPIVVNDRLKKGKQFLSTNEDYPIRYYIIEEMNRG